MSQTYKFKTLSIGQEKSEETKENNPNKLTVYEIGDTKTIDFIQKDGTRQNFPYAHYLTSWFTKENNERIIKIIFATHHITIHGYGLTQIYEHLKDFNLKTIKANDLRYYNDDESNKVFISGIEVGWKKEIK